MTKYSLILLITLCACTKAQTVSIQLNGAPEKLSLFAEGNISTQMNERDFAISPDGNEIFYTISTPRSTFQTIVFSKKVKEGVWTKPEIASFAGVYSDLEPVFSADGNTLLFSSNRPINGNEMKDFDIWKVSRQGNGWGQPENLGSVINTEADEFYPSIAKNGNLYFTAAYQGGPGREDIYLSKWENNQYQKPEALDSAINSAVFEFNAFVSPNEDYILFTSYGRAEGAGGGDLYISLKNDSGKWQPAVYLTDLNSAQLDYCPFVSPDGKTLFVTSDRHLLPVSYKEAKATYQSVFEAATNPLNGTGNIYWVDFEKILKALSN
jgi:Tol biopolymer transport system component